MSDTENFHFVFPLRIYVEDTDAGGIVYYVNYLKFMERARTEFIRKLGFEQKLGCFSENKSEIQFVVHSADVKYLKPARMDMMVLVSVRLVKLARTYFILEQKVLEQNIPEQTAAAAEQLQVFCSATVKIACVSSGTFRPLHMPEQVMKGLQQYV